MIYQPNYQLDIVILLYEPKRDIFVVFGGSNDEKLFRDIIIMKIYKDKKEKFHFKYEKIEQESSPEARFEHGACLVGQKIYIFG